jgi:hypothetical protein
VNGVDIAVFIEANESFILADKLRGGAAAGSAPGAPSDRTFAFAFNRDKYMKTKNIERRATGMTILKSKLAVAPRGSPVRTPG